MALSLFLLVASALGVLANWLTSGRRALDGHTVKIISESALIDGHIIKVAVDSLAVRRRVRL